MNRERYLTLIGTHNKNVEGFKRFCETLDKECGKVTMDVFFKMQQNTPPFANHAAEIVSLAKKAGINAKYNAQDGEINIYES